MMIEENIPDNFRRSAYHPSHFVYAWKKKDLEKLFDELMKCNIAVIKSEAWLIDEELIETVIPLKDGDLEVYFFKISPNPDEEWYDFVERSAKETLETINNWHIEKSARTDMADKIWYNFVFSQR